MKVQLSSVEFWRDVRGPGPRNQSDLSAAFSTTRVKPGDKEPTTTGLMIVWDQESRVVVLAKDSPSDPVIVYPLHEVRRMIPAEPTQYLSALLEEPPKRVRGA